MESRARSRLLWAVNTTARIFTPFRRHIICALADKISRYQVSRPASMNLISSCSRLSRRRRELISRFSPSRASWHFPRRQRRIARSRATSKREPLPRRASPSYRPRLSSLPHTSIIADGEPSPPLQSLLHHHYARHQYDASVLQWSPPAAQRK